MSLSKKQYFNIQEDVYHMTREQFIQKYGNASGEMWDRYHKEDNHTFDDYINSFEDDR